MGATTRHYRALMKKNFINWKRTPCGSLCEIICPILLMLIMVAARSMIDPVNNDDWSLYSLRRAYYPIAKPEEGDIFSVSVHDQTRQLDDYKEFFSYMDGHNINITHPVNVTKVVELVREVASEINNNSPTTTGSGRLLQDISELIAGQGLEVTSDFKDDLLTLTNLTALIAQTPIKDFTSRMNWDLLGQFLEVLGLDEIIPLDTLKTFLEDVEEVLENPEALIQDITGINITAVVEQALAALPEEAAIDLETYLINNYELINIKIEGYLPLRDRFSPYFFFPKHCYPKKDNDKSER